MWFIVPFLQNFIHGNVNSSVKALTLFVSDVVLLFGFRPNTHAGHYGTYILAYIMLSMMLIAFSLSKNNKSRYTKIGIYTFIIFVLYLIMTFDNPILKFFTSNKMLSDIYGKQQFSIRVIGRSLTYLCLSIAFLLGATIDYIAQKTHIKIFKYIIEGICFIILIMFVFVADKKILTVNEIGVETTKLTENLEHINALGEYAVKNLNDRVIKYQNVNTTPDKENPNIKTSSQNIEIYNVNRKYLYYDVSYRINNYNEKTNYFIDIPFRPYKGFAAYNIRIPIYYTNILDTGQKNIRIKLDGVEGRVVVELEKNIHYTISKLISILFVLYLIICGIKKILPKKKVIFKQSKIKIINIIKLKINNACDFIKRNNIVSNIVVFLIILLYIYISSIKVSYGWIKNNNKWEYIDEYNVKVYDSWVDNEYYVGSDGYMVTNDFISEGNKLYFVDSM